MILETSLRHPQRLLRTFSQKLCRDLVSGPLLTSCKDLLSRRLFRISLKTSFEDLSKDLLSRHLRTTSIKTSFEDLPSTLSHRSKSDDSSAFRDRDTLWTRGQQATPKATTVPRFATTTRPIPVTVDTFDDAVETFRIQHCAFLALVSLSDTRERLWTLCERLRTLCERFATGFRANSLTPRPPAPTSKREPFCRAFGKTCSVISYISGCYIARILPSILLVRVVLGFRHFNDTKQRRTFTGSKLSMVQPWMRKNNMGLEREAQVPLSGEAFSTCSSRSLRLCGFVGFSCWSCWSL